jgi:thiazole synthase
MSTTAEKLRQSAQHRAPQADAPLVVAGVEYRSRLLVGTGKYKDFDETRQAIEASGAEIVTVAIRRTNIGQNAGEPNLLIIFRPTGTPCCQIPRAASTPDRRCAPAAWHASCSTGTT